MIEGLFIFAWLSLIFYMVIKDYSIKDNQESTDIKNKVKEYENKAELRRLQAKVRYYTKKNKGVC